jgi:hypothetical protein
MERACNGELMRVWLFSFVLVVALGSTSSARAQSEATFPDVGSSAQKAASPAQPTDPPAADPPATQSAEAPAPAQAVVAPAPSAPATPSLALASPQPAPRWDVEHSLAAPSYSGWRRVPPDYVREDRPRTLTLALGGVALGLPWATGLGIAAASGFANGSAWLAAPVVGPWAALAKRSNPCNGLDKATSFNPKVGECVAEPLARAMLVVDGVLQATGGVLLVLGMRSDTVLVKKSPSALVGVAPSPIGDHGYGVQMFGLF